MAHVIKRGLDLPISGRPIQEIRPGPAITTVGYVGDDFVGFRPTMLVKEGDSVRLGQPVMSDKKMPAVLFTAPCSGRVLRIVRGEKRKFESIVFEVEGNEEQRFTPIESPVDATAADVRKLLLESGMWIVIRARPYSRIPDPATNPHSLFVTAMDTRPLSAEPELIIEQSKTAFVHGLHLLRRMADGPLYVCTRTDSRIAGRDVPGVTFEEFAGPHPAGLPGTHIHLLDAVGSRKTAWHLNYQEVIAIGHLGLTGRLMEERVVALGGPVVREPALYRTRLGADVRQFVAGNLTGGRRRDHDAYRVISGSVLYGRTVAEPHVFLGRYDLQVSVLEEGRQREFLGWQRPGKDKFSVTKAYVGSWLKGRLFTMNTNLNGGHRAIVPIGTYERVMPLDVMPTHLLKALIVGDTEQSQALGALELDEEDLSLCTYVCPGKYDYGAILRDNLTRMEKEG